MTIPYSADIDKHIRIYISGPMTGYPDLNEPAFVAAAEMLRGLGFEAVDPSVHKLGSEANWSDYLRIDLADMLTCSAVCVLPGWEKSTGASLEVEVAKALGMPVTPLALWEIFTSIGIFPGVDPKPSPTPVPVGE